MSLLQFALHLKWRLWLQLGELNKFHDHRHPSFRERITRHQCLYSYGTFVHQAPHNPFPFPGVQRSVMKWITKEEKNNHHQMPRHVTDPQSHLHTIHPSPKHLPRRKWSVLWVFFISHNMGKGGHKDRGPGPPPFRILSSSLTSFLFSQHGSKGKMVQG